MLLPVGQIRLPEFDRDLKWCARRGVAKGPFPVKLTRKNPKVWAARRDAHAATQWERPVMNAAIVPRRLAVLVLSARSPVLDVIRSCVAP